LHKIFDLKEIKQGGQLVFSTGGDIRQSKITAEFCVILWIIISVCPLENT
jgi:hypothetical protein